MNMQHGDTLILCRTPFQAVVIKSIMRHEDIENFDIIYLTHNDSEEDKSYFKYFSNIANSANYVCVSRKRFAISYAIYAYLQLKKSIKHKFYSRILISSFDNLAFRKVVSKYNDAMIISFDEGTGYINEDSIYSDARENFRDVIYNNIFGVCSKADFKFLVSRHYSIYPGFDNIMPASVLRYIDIVEAPVVEKCPARKTSFFIGQPFHEYLDSRYLSNIKEFLTRKNIDFYIKHPRETTPLIDSVPLLSKNGKIAEEAIFRACEGRRPVLFGGFSSVMFNISADLADKVMILRRNNEKDAALAELGRMAGCEIVFV